MSGIVKSVVSGLFALFVAAGLAFGAAQLTATPLGNPLCGDEEDGSELGTCPPFTMSSCIDACEEMFGSTGACAPSGEGPCCTCAV